MRLLKRLTPQRGPTVAVILLGVVGIAIGVVGPRILGMPPICCSTASSAAELPAGLTKEQAVEAARARGDDTFADLLSGMNVVPGQGVDFGAVGRTLALALALYLVAALLVWLQARLLNVTVQRTMRRCAPTSRTRCTGYRCVTSIRGSAARCSAGSPTTSTTCRRRCRCRSPSC